MDKIRLTPAEATRIITALRRMCVVMTLNTTQFGYYADLTKKFENAITHWGPTQSWELVPEGLAAQSKDIITIYNCRCGQSTSAFATKGQCAGCGVQFEILPKEDTNLDGELYESI